MKFNKSHKVIPNSLNREQAKVFIIFLKSEILRHEEDIAETRELIIRIRNKFQIYD